MDLVFGVFTFMRMAWQADARRLGLSGALLGIQATTMPGAAYALQRLTDGALAGDKVAVVAAAVCVSALVVASIATGHLAHIFYFELGDALELRLQGELMDISNGSSGLAHHESPEFNDRLQVLRQEMTRLGAHVTEAVLGWLGSGINMLLTRLSSP